MKIHDVHNVCVCVHCVFFSLLCFSIYIAVDLAVHVDTLYMNIAQVSTPVLHTIIITLARILLLQAPRQHYKASLCYMHVCVACFLSLLVCVCVCVLDVSFFLEVAIS